MKYYYYLFVFILIQSFGVQSQTKKPSKKPTKEEIEKLKKRVIYPKLLKYIAAKYPEKAVKENREGTVLLTVSIDETGKVIGVEVKKSAGSDLDEAAKEAVMKFLFTPASIDGKAIPVKIPLAYPFKLRKSDTQPVKKPDDKNAVKVDGKKTDPGKTQDKKPDQNSKNPAIDGKTTSTVRKPPEKKNENSELSGRLWEKGRRFRLKNAQVRLWQVKSDGSRLENPQDVVYSDNKGFFGFKNVPPGNYFIEVIIEGFKTLNDNVLILPSSKARVNLYVERSTKDDYSIIVTGKADKKEVARYSLELSEVQTIPGTQGDAIRAIQNMPGVARSPFNLGLIVVRGSAPGDTRVFFEGHEIPQLFHFLGLTSVYNSDLLKKIDFIPGNFSVRYGRATGGIIDVYTRNPKKDGFHGYIDLDIWDAGALVEGPIGDGSFAISVRRSWIDSILRLIPEVGIAPVYYDYQGILSYPLFGGNFKFMVFGSDDRLFLLEDDSTPYITNFQKAIAIYSKRDGKNYFKGSFGAGINDLTFGVDEFNFNLNYYRLNWRSEYTRTFTKDLKLTVGMDGEFTDADVTLTFENRAAVTDDNPTGQTGFNVKDYLLNQALWMEATWKPFSRLTLIPGIRTDFLKTETSRYVVADPRITAKVEAKKDTLFINAGIGIFHQEPELYQLSPEIFGNPDLKQENSVHASLGFFWKIMPSMTLEMTGFYKNMWNLIVENPNITQGDNSVVTDYMVNKGIGRVYGGEFLFKKQTSTTCPPIWGMQKCFGWLSYTLLRSERKDNDEEGWKLFGFDQTHILTAIFSGIWNGGWQVGFRFRLSTGIPITPIVGGIYDADTGRYIGVEGKPYSERMPLFHQLDFRIDKKFKFNTWSLTVYLDIQNVYNYQVSEFLTYNFNYTQRTTVAGLPIVPSIGIKGSF
ncbi:MAG: TonB family protein [Deltaproteobacteria bacterium]|nr:TonB family protein [Deltaproteobacteria bacterium]